MNDRLRTHLAAGGSATVQTATTATIEIDGERVALGLERRVGRLLVENAALIAAASSGADEIENL